MKKTSKWIALLLVLTLVLSAGVVASAEELSDIADTKYETAVLTLIEAGVISGYPDGTFKPENSITRAEASKIVVLATGVTEGAITAAAETADFSDMEGHWAADYVAYAAAEGILNGYPDGTFKPDNNVTYYEITKMLVASTGVTADMLEGQWPDNYAHFGRAAGLYLEVDFEDGNAASCRGDVALMTLNTYVRQVPVEVNAVMERSTALAEDFGKRLSDTDWGDRHQVLVASGEGAEHSDYAALKEVLDGFRVESGAYYVYVMIPNEDNDYCITVDGSEEPDDYGANYGWEIQFDEAWAGEAAAARSAWDDSEDDLCWSAFAPVYNTADEVVAIVGVDFPCPEILEFPEWNRDAEEWNGVEF